VKLADGTTTLMRDTAENQADFPQHGSQMAGAGFPIARLMGVMSLATGVVLDIAMGQSVATRIGVIWAASGADDSSVAKSVEARAVTSLDHR
jgi:hypothetical protein